MHPLSKRVAVWLIVYDTAVANMWCIKVGDECALFPTLRSTASRISGGMSYVWCKPINSSLTCAFQSR